MMSLRPSESKISVTAEPIWLFSSGNKPTGTVVVLSYFHGGLDTPTKLSALRGLKVFLFEANYLENG